MPAIQNKPRWKSLLCSPDWLLALALTVFVVWLHVYFLLHAGGFWRDEVNLINLAGTHSFAQMERDSFPILMPLLVGVWSAFVPAHSDLGLRLLGTLIGLGIPAALWLVAWRARRSPPVLGLALLALNFTLILYGDSLRGYGLGSLMIILAVFAACAFLKNPDWKRTALFTALATLSAQALYQNAAFVAAICFGAWAVCLREKNWKAAAKIFIVAAVSAASLLPYFAQIASLPNASVSLRSGFDPQLIRINLDNALGLPLEQYVWIWAVLALITFGCAVTAAVSSAVLSPASLSRRCEAKADSPVTQRTALVVALASAFGVSWFIVSPETRWYFFPIIILAITYLDSGHWLKFVKTTVPPADPPADHYALFAGVTLFTGLAGFGGFLWYAALPTEAWYFLPLMALAAACFETGLPRTLHARAAVFGLAITTVIGVGYFARADLGMRMTNIDLIAQQVSAQAAPDDFVIVSPWYDGITFNRYYHGPAAWNTVPPLADHASHRYDQVLDEMKTPDAMQPLYDKISATLRSGHRVWFVGAATAHRAGAPMPADPLPPPLKHSGWSDRPYDITWENQVVQYLGNHSRTFTLVYASTNLNVNATECLKLDMTQGWQGK
jgi:hypothetical protein